MANSFTKDVLVQVEDVKNAAEFYVQNLGFEITKESPSFISLHGHNINLFLDQGDKLGPVLEIKVNDLEEAKNKLLQAGCEVIVWQVNGPRKYIRDPNGLIYNLAI